MQNYSTIYHTIVEEDDISFDEKCAELSKEGWVLMSPLQVIVLTNEHGQYKLFIQQWQKCTPTFKSITFSEEDINKMISDMQDERDQEMSHAEAMHRISLLTEFKNNM